MALPLGDDILVGPATPSTSVTEDMTEDGSRIDVLVVYTSNGRSELGSRERIEVRIDFSVAQTNMAYTNSGVHQRIHLVQAVEVDYVSDGYTNTDVTRLEDPDDGFMDSIHALRDRYSADLVHLLVPVTDAHGRRGKFDVGGRALLGPSPEAAFSMCTMLPPDATNWVAWQPRCLAHELGHNQGLLHDRWDQQNSGSDLTDSFLPYSYGYVNQRAFDQGGTELSYWLTIMAEYGQCNDCRAVPRFSNPDQTYNGDPLGVPGDEHSSSVTGPADARRHLNETKVIVANLRNPVPRVLDFAHFANGEGTTSDLVLVNVASYPIAPIIHFYDQAGDPIAAESVVEITGALEVREDGGLMVRTEMEPLGELTISTHGQGALVSGSVKVVSDGPIGGVLRFYLPDIGVAGVGASQPVRDALFPARRQARGISTGVAIHNLGEGAIEVICRLMKEGAVLEEVKIPLEANGQKAQFIEEMFTRTDTSDFVGLVRCIAPGLLTGVALELDAANRIFTTLPVVPVE